MNDSVKFVLGSVGVIVFFILFFWLLTGRAFMTAEERIQERMARNITICINDGGNPVDCAEAYARVYGQ